MESEEMEMLILPAPILPITPRVDTLFQAKKSRTFRGLSRTILKFQGLFFIRIYLQPSKMFVSKAMFWAQNLFSLAFI